MQNEPTFARAVMQNQSSSSKQQQEINYRHPSPISQNRSAVSYKTPNKDAIMRNQSELHQAAGEQKQRSAQQHPGQSPNQ